MTGYLIVSEYLIPLCSSLHPSDHAALSVYLSLQVVCHWDSHQSGPGGSVWPHVLPACCPIAPALLVEPGLPTTHRSRLPCRCGTGLCSRCWATSGFTSHVSHVWGTPQVVKQPFDGEDLHYVRVACVGMTCSFSIIAPLRCSAIPVSPHQQFSVLPSPSACPLWLQGVQG